MKARDEFAWDIFSIDNAAIPDDALRQDFPHEADYAFHIAEGLIEAGYRKPRTITTAEELDALPDAVLILTEQGGYWESIKRMDRKNWWKEPGATSVVPSEDLTLPATILHEGAQP